MVSFCLAGVVVRATFGFFLLVFLFLLADSGGMALWVLTGCLLHEGGHLLSMLAMRVPVRRLELTAAGIHIRRGRESLSPGRELLVLAAGPGINLLTALVLFLLGWMECSAANCALGLFHLLPARGLDGGSIMEICCRRFWGMERGCLLYTSQLPGQPCQLLVNLGQTLRTGDPLPVLIPKTGGDIQTGGVDVG